MVRLVEEQSTPFKKETVRRFTWYSASGVSVTVISYGAIIQSVKVPDKNGEIADVTLGFDDVDSYVHRNVPYFGATVGRCANRIGGANFSIDGVDYKLAKNIGENHLHGGIIGFDKVNWHTTVDGNRVIFSYLSVDGEEGYPGDLVTSVTYELTEDDRFHVDFVSSTTKKTVVNLTNHSYFNLAGHDGGVDELMKHVVAVFADKITETDGNSIPTGRLSNVGGTPFDLRTPKRLGDILSKNPMLFDDNFCITTFGKEGLQYISRVVHPPPGRYLEVHSDQPGVQLYTSNGLPINPVGCQFMVKGLQYISRVVHPPSGRYLEVYSDQPGVQLYTSYFLPAPEDKALVGKGGVGYRRHGAFCLETQKYPDAVHHENFPSPILKPGDVYRHRVVYAFGAERGCEPTVMAS